MERVAVIPTDAEVDIQLARIGRHESFRKGQGAWKLLRYLVRAKRAGRFARVPASPSSVRQAYWENEVRAEWNQKADATSRAAFKSVRDKLDLYYYRLPPDSEDRVLMKISDGFGRSYEPEFEYRDVSRQEQVNLRYLGNHAQAMHYLISLIPDAVAIDDTTVRWHTSRSTITSPKLMKSFEAALAQNPNLTFRSITGPIVDPAYAEVLSNAFREKLSKLDARRIDHTSPMLNFLFLRGRRKDTAAKFEVVFWGFGRQSSDDGPDDTPVFCSEDRVLVTEYKRLFKGLHDKRFSRAISVDDADFSLTREYRSEIIATFDTWPSEIGERIRNCRREVKICTTAWTRLSAHVPDLHYALYKGRSVTVALWKPESPTILLRAKDVLSEIPGQSGNFLAEMIRDQHNELTRLRESYPSLQLPECDGWAAISCFIIDDHTYFSPFWSGSEALQGPYFLTMASSNLGKVIKSQFAVMTTTSE